jgi:hypothetical protein
LTTFIACQLKQLFTKRIECYTFPLPTKNNFIESGHAVPGLPDGKFSNQKSQFGQISLCLAKKEVGIFYGHLVYFTAIWNIL